MVAPGGTDASGQALKVQSQTILSFSEPCTAAMRTPPNTERYETKKKKLSSWVKNSKTKFYLDKLKTLVDFLQMESSQVQL